MLDERVDNGLGVFAVERRTASGRKQKVAVSLNETVERPLSEIRATRFPTTPIATIARQLDEDATI